MNETIAKKVSLVLHPFALIIPFLLLAVYSPHINLQSSAFWFIVSFVPFFLIPFAIFIYLIKNKIISSHEGEQREERPVFFLITTIMWLISAGILYFFNAPKNLFALILSSAITAAIITFVTLRWKISVHTGVLAVFVAWALLVFGLPATPLLILLPISLWARYKLKYHTIAQLLAGIFVGAFSTAVVWWIV
ncbi:MAG: hypothetical protein HYT16_01010 [DPANN group archaeon]|nr:hypothetical protein [DPANN group archaeon]